MTPYEQAEQVALKLGMNFHKVLMEHFQENSYVYSSPDCFILAVDAVREFGESRHDMAVFVTLAAGKLSHFLAIDPLRERRKWLGWCREDGGEVHWLDYQKLRRQNTLKNESLPVSQK
jgi:hypothetical protein